VQDFEWLGYSVSARRMTDGNTWIVAGSPTYRLCALYTLLTYRSIYLPLMCRLLVTVSCQLRVG